MRRFFKIFIKKLKKDLKEAEKRVKISVDISRQNFAKGDGTEKIKCSILR